MIGALLRRIAAGESLDREEAQKLALAFMDGEATDSQIGAALMGMALRGETSDEIAGMASAMRERCLRVTSTRRLLVDNAGTGGDGASTFNISTAAAFVIAAAGVPVAKHGRGHGDYCRNAAGF